jgi:hypothetical protein
MDLPIKLEVVANEGNDQEFNGSQSKDEMSECESENDSSSGAGSEYILK